MRPTYPGNEGCEPCLSCNKPFAPEHGSDGVCDDCIKSGYDAEKYDEMRDEG